MDKSNISSWVRQARHRAKKHDIHNNLTIEEVEQVLTNYQGKCAYCTKSAETLDHSFPLKDGAPNVQANILPCCRECKEVKKTNDLAWMFSQGYIQNAQYVKILGDMLNLNGNTELKQHVKKITGMSDD